jgi:hypothetical protein
VPRDDGDNDDNNNHMEPMQTTRTQSSTNQA